MWLSLTHFICPCLAKLSCLYAGDVHQLPGVLTAHSVMLGGPFHLQALALKLRYLAMKGAEFQSIFSKPPLVAQLSAFQRLE
ncbi:unnamed protein product [Linum tenue]|uniref:Uncharacterized protein n=1 Tax=Linum tenue TaxID=586396 RepID=A0AAV0QGB4_9ROSI|nr:unnamed protein product [Linum tenue]